MEDFADTAYAFMTGIPGFGNRGFAMMDPECLKKQRITYVRYWAGKLNADVKTAVNALTRR